MRLFSLLDFWGKRDGGRAERSWLERFVVEDLTFLQVSQNLEVVEEA